MNERAERLADVLREVALERARQDAQWGGPDHDDQHGREAWLLFIRKQWLRASEDAFADRGDAYRRRLVNIAALAVAAIEVHDRQAAGGWS